MLSKTLITRLRPFRKWCVSLHTTDCGFRYPAFRAGKLAYAGTAAAKEEFSQAASEGTGGLHFRRCTASTSGTFDQEITVHACGINPRLRANLIVRGTETMDIFDIKPLDKGWYYRCRSRGVSAGDRLWSRAEAIYQAEMKAKMYLPAEIDLYDKEGERIIAFFRLDN